MSTRAVVLFCAGLFICLELSACASWPIGHGADNSRIHQIIDAPAERRESLWQQHQSKPANDIGRALLQSLPGHSGFAPEHAQITIQQLVDSGNLSNATQRLLRVRLIGLERELVLARRMRELDQRLQTIIDIEQQLDQKTP